MKTCKISKLFRKLLFMTIVLVWTGSLTIFANGLNSTDNSIIGIWKWIETVTPVETVKPLPGKIYQLSFHENGTLSMKLEMNQVNGNYEADGGKLKIIPPMMTTLGAWLPDSPAPAFLNLIEHAAGYFIRDGELFIDTVADGGTLHFSPVSPTDS